ncbi:MAG TPA: superoxide dismutase [Verrucomicrobiota bacterium]|nr:superoxide dismutase [Verrucomicrobiota bacterium]HNT15642.1 superoxide dismutase [Verrucomicrobiota bacterium]
MMTRRQAIKTTAMLATASAVVPGALAQPTPAAVASASPFKLPPLPYAFDALEPHLDARTMEIHHDKHHQAYVDNLNKAFAQMPWGGALPTFSHLENNWLKNPKFLSENPAVRNNGGGHYNHSLFWQMMKKNGGGEPKAELARAIEKHFGNFTDFKTKFSDAAMKQFGSGWAWLVSHEGKLAIESTPNQDTPLSTGKQPLLGLDVWEHAYYLKYQNKRADYITAWWNVVNWDFVAERHARLQG